MAVLTAGWQKLDVSFVVTTIFDHDCSVHLELTPDSIKALEKAAREFDYVAARKS